MDETFRELLSVNEKGVEEKPISAPIGPAPKNTGTDKLIDSCCSNVFSNQDQKDCANPHSAAQHSLLLNSHEILQTAGLDYLENSHTFSSFYESDNNQTTLSSEFENLLNSKINNKTIILEQLKDLEELLSEKSNELSKEIINNIYSFAIELAKNNENDFLDIGRLLYLTNHLSQKEMQQLFLQNKSPSIELIQQLFNSHVSNYYVLITQLKQQLGLLPIQDPNLVARNQGAILLADILLLNTGKINFGIIDLLIKDFLVDKNDSVEFKENQISSLKAFLKDPILRQKLSAIKAPESLNSPAQTVIRTTLGLSASQKTTHLDAKKTVLAAIISHLRQGKEGSCFATPLAVFLLSNRIELCLDDFSSLLQSSKLTRKVDNTICDFPFMLKISGNQQDKSIQVFCDEDIQAIAFHPGFIAAGKAAGIDNPQAALQNILKPYHKTKSNTSITIKTILEQIALYAKKEDRNKKTGLGTLFLTASFAYEAQETNPLLQVWQNALAGMAEPNESGMILSAIIDTILSIMKKKLKEHLPESRAFRKKFKETFREELKHTLYLQYDPIIPSHSVAEDQRSTEGAFVLFERISNETHTKNDRIDNPESFKHCMAKVFDQVKEKVKLEKNSISKKAISSTFTKIKTYLLSDAFIIASLIGYYRRNEEIPNPLKNLEKIKYSPWITKSGNNFSKVVQVYFEEFVSSNSVVITPKGSKDLLLNIRHLGLSMIQNNEENTQPTLIPVRIPKLHAFNLLLSHPTIQHLWANEETFSNWLNLQFLLPGKQIAESVVDEKTINLFMKSIFEELLPKEIRQIIGTIPLKFPKEMKIRELKSTALEKLKLLFEKHCIEFTDPGKQVDLILMDSLPKKLKKQIKSSAVHFADTNWSDGVHDIHFCFLVNPGTGELEIFACCDNNEKFFPIDMKQWIPEKKWEFFTEIYQAKRKL